MKSKSPWILNVLYVNPEDKRILVPYPFKLGFSFNYGNPRAIRFFSWTILLVLMSLIIIPSVIHKQYISNNLTPILWVFFSCLSALFILFFNGFDKSLIWRKLPNFSFGFLAVVIGFAGQSIINGPIVYWIGMENLNWIHHLILAPVAAVFQTLGKILIILFILRILGEINYNKYIIYALIIGFGFTISEIVYIGSQVIITELALTTYLGVCERAISSMFHIYSAGLLAIGLREKKYLFILLVIAIHAITDFIAGISSTISVSVYTLETIFSIFSMLIWIVFLFAINQRKPEFNNERI